MPGGVGGARASLASTRFLGGPGVAEAPGLPDKGGDAASGHSELVHRCRRDRAHRRKQGPRRHAELRLWLRSARAPVPPPGSIRPDVPTTVKRWEGVRIGTAALPGYAFGGSERSVAASVPDRQRWLDSLRVSSATRGVVPRLCPASVDPPWRHATLRLQ